MTFLIVGIVGIVLGLNAASGGTPLILFAALGLTVLGIVLAWSSNRQAEKLREPLVKRARQNRQERERRLALTGEQ